MFCDADEYSSWDQADQMADRAFELYEDGQISQALAQLAEAVEINPGNSAWHFNIGLALDSMDNFEMAIEAYEKALNLTPDDPETLNCLAIDYTRTGEYDLALATFDKIQKIAPHFEPGYCNRIITYTEMDQHEKAEQMFYLAQQINPDCPICFYNVGNSLFSRRQYERAIWCWERTAMLEPTHPQINYRIAQAYWANGDLVQAKEYFLHQLRNSPGDVDVILDFGIFLLKVGQLDAAREKFNRILELQPDFTSAVFYLGELALIQDRSVEASRLYCRAIKEDPDLAGPRYRLAQIALGDGSCDEAKKVLLDELKLKIDDIDVLLSIAVMFIQLGELDLAMDTLLGVVDEDRNNATAFYYMGMLMALQGDHEGALHFFEHAMTIDDTNPNLLADAALIYLSNGRAEQAHRAIAAARELAPSDKKIARLWRKTQLATITANIRRYLASSPAAVKITLLAARYKSRINRLIKTRNLTR